MLQQPNKSPEKELLSTTLSPPTLLDRSGSLSATDGNGNPFETVEGISGLSVQTDVATPFFPYHIEKAIENVRLNLTIKA
jgi:hypothetical protein